jgi:hypothetical protein
MKLIVFITYHILKRATPLTLLCESQFSLMTHLICQVQLLNRVIEVPLARIILLSHFLMLYSECPVFQVKFLKVHLQLPELKLEFFDPLLPLLLYFPESNDFTLALLELNV